MIARCKFILKERVFGIATVGTFVMHPGICPEYRNAHGCFWALVRRDVSKVGMTLLRADAGVDTGPIFGYFTYDFDERRESHLQIGQRCVSENFDEIAAKLKEVAAGRAQPIPVDGRKSGVWGQPWMTKYVQWKLAARRLTT
jgi:methionyl-tRNA formyltransferase